MLTVSIKDTPRGCFFWYNISMNRKSIQGVNEVKKISNSITFLIIIFVLVTNLPFESIIKNLNFNIMDIILIIVALLLVFIILTGLRIINEYDRGVVLTFGKYSGTRNPGLTWILWPFGIQKIIKVDLRVKAVDVPDQKAITKDNISVDVNAVIYYKVNDANKAVLEVEDYYHAISQLAQTTMRDVVGEVELDQLLAERDNISERIRQIVDETSDAWGIKVNSVSLKDVALPANMERTIAKQAEAEREKRAVIIKAEGEVAAAQNMSEAAKMLSGTTGALHLRTLQSLNDLSSDQSNTVIFALPLEILRAFEKYNNSTDK
jgi:regulator of protease activity HflC (stomatin/prohibitin superfamily)